MCRTPIAILPCTWRLEKVGILSYREMFNNILPVLVTCSPWHMYLIALYEVSMVASQGIWRLWRRYLRGMQMRTSATPRGMRRCTARRARGTWRLSCVWWRPEPHPARGRTWMSCACCAAKPPIGNALHPPDLLKIVAKRFLAAGDLHALIRSNTLRVASCSADPEDSFMRHVLQLACWGGM